MSTKVAMPKLGLTMTEGKIVEWKKTPGQQVTKGEILFVIETEKVTFEVEAPTSGILGNLLAKIADVIPVGEPVVYILAPGERETPDEPVAYVKPVAFPAGETTPGTRSSTETTPGEKLRASPLARRVAEDHKIDIASLKGSGPGGRIVKEDVLLAVAERKKQQNVAREPVASSGEVSQHETMVPLTSMRRTIARRMSQSFQTAPHFWLSVECDVTELKKAKESLMPWIEKKTGVKLTLTDLLLKIVATVLREQPGVNSTWTDQGIRLIGDINIGVAVSLEGGLVVPVFRLADQKQLEQLAVERVQLVERARSKKLTPDDVTGGTFTLNNLGMFGIENANVIINPPESAILLVGAIVDKPAAVNGKVKIRPRMAMTLAIDHRTLDGVAGARFLTRVKELIEDPILFMAR